jgi:hypothetical protein
MGTSDLIQNNELLGLSRRKRTDMAAKDTAHLGALFHAEAISAPRRARVLLADALDMLRRWIADASALLELAAVTANK